MNNTLKTILIILNVLMLVIAGYWYYKQNEPEPIIVILGQVATLLALIFEKQASSIFTKDINNSEIKIASKPGENIRTKKIKDSTIHIDVN